MMVACTGKDAYMNGVIRRIKVEQVRIQDMLRIILDEYPVSGFGPEAKNESIAHVMKTGFRTFAKHAISAVVPFFHLTELQSDAAFHSLWTFPEEMTMEASHPIENIF
jgi:hypothetical protein